MASGVATEIWRGRRGSLDSKGVREYTRVLRVLTSDPTDGSIVVRQAIGIPRIADPYFSGNEADSGARCVRVEPREDQDHPQVWLVTADYSSDFGGQTDRQQPNPLDRAAEYTWSFAHFTRAVDKDVNGRPITNSADDRFDPPLERDDPRLQLAIKVNRPLYNAIAVQQLANCVNNRDFLGGARAEWRLDDAGATSKTENGIFYWEINYVFQYRGGGWNPVEELDYGAYQIVNGEKIRITDGRGNPIEDLLDGKGAQLARGADAVYRKFTMYAEKDFGPLGLG